MRMKYKEWMEYEPYWSSMRNGQTIRIYHCKPEGSRGNDGFCITRSIDGSFLYYCHHCGISGNFGSGRSYRSTRECLPESTEQTNLSYPEDVVSNINEWPRQYKVWLWKYGITQDEVNKYRLGYVPSLQRFILPSFSADGSLSSYDLRGLEGTSKYIRKGSASSGFWSSMGHDNSNRCCLVEDVISGIKVGRHTKAYVLSGTNLHDKVFHHIISNHKEFILWLDDDNRQVKMKQLKIKNRLEMFGKTVIIHTQGKDPKEHSDNDIKAIIGDKK